VTALELIQRIVTARQGDAVGSQVVEIAENRLEDANPNALALILVELQNLQRPELG
jgi:hypothetical protein